MARDSSEPVKSPVSLFCAYPLSEESLRQSEKVIFPSANIALEFHRERQLDEQVSLSIDYSIGECRNAFCDERVDLGFDPVRRAQRALDTADPNPSDEGHPDIQRSRNGVCGGIDRADYL